MSKAFVFCINIEESVNQSCKVWRKVNHSIF